MSGHSDRPLELPECKPKEDSRRGSQSLNIIGWLILLTVIIFALRPTAFSEFLSVQNTPTPSPLATAVRPNPYIGPLDAPVTLVEFGDFACPACGVWNESGTIKKLIDKYGGQIRFVWADFPSVSPDSLNAAEAARCAYDQGKFWEYHDYLFSHMETLGRNNLKIYASLLGLDRTQFDRCLDTETEKAEISLDYHDALSRQVEILPTFLIQTKSSEVLLVGQLSLNELVSAIDPLLTPAPK